MPPYAVNTVKLIIVPRTGVRLVNYTIVGQQGVLLFGMTVSNVAGPITIIHISPGYKLAQVEILRRVYE